MAVGNLTNDFLLDDVPNTTMGYNGVAIIPPVDAVQEFNVLTNSFSAKYGRNRRWLNHRQSPSPEQMLFTEVRGNLYATTTWMPMISLQTVAEES